jgi:transposase
MLQLKLKGHLIKDEIKKRLDSQVSARGYRQWQILYAVISNPGKKSEDMAQVLGISKEILQRTVKQYNKNGADFQEKIRWGGRRKETSYLTLEEEQQMLNEFSKKALAGKILTAKDIKREVEKKLNTKVSDDYIWDLFNRCKWSKKAPRPKHPKQSKTAQEEFKKNSPKSWQPST